MIFDTASSPVGIDHLKRSLEHAFQKMRILVVLAQNSVDTDVGGDDGDKDETLSILEPRKYFGAFLCLIELCRCKFTIC